MCTAHAIDKAAIRAACSLAREKGRARCGPWLITARFVKRDHVVPDWRWHWHYTADRRDGPSVTGTLEDVVGEILGGGYVL